jgi:hypothetical protein
MNQAAETAPVIERDRAAALMEPRSGDRTAETFELARADF